MTSDVDPSAPTPKGIRKWSEEWWAQVKPETQARRCKAHRTDGTRCRRLALNFQKVCSHHGGKARQSVEAARKRMMEQADPAVRQLQKIAFDDTAAIETRLKATLAIIDRTGLGPRTTVDLEIQKPAYETIFESMSVEVSSRAAFRGEPEVLPSLKSSTADPLADELEAGDADVIDVEVEDDQGYPITPDDRESRSPFDTAPWRSPFDPPAPPPGQGLMTMEDAVAANREAQRQHAISRRGLRR